MREDVRPLLGEHIQVVVVLLGHLVEQVGMGRGGGGVGGGGGREADGTGGDEGRRREERGRRGVLGPLPIVTSVPLASLLTRSSELGPALVSFVYNECVLIANSTCPTSLSFQM